MQTRKFRAAVTFFWKLRAVLFDSVGLCQPHCIFDLLDVGNIKRTSRLVKGNIKTCEKLVTSYILATFENRLHQLCHDIFFGRLMEVSWFSSFPRYGKLLNRYFVSTSTAIQNLIPSLSGLFGMN